MLQNCTFRADCRNSNTCRRAITTESEATFTPDVAFFTTVKSDGYKYHNCADYVNIEDPEADCPKQAFHNSDYSSLT